MYDVNVEVTYSADLLPALVSGGEVQAYRYIRKQPGGGCDCNYTAIKDTLYTDKWVTNEIHEEGEFPVQQDLMTLVTLDSTTQYQIDKTKENTFVIGNANDSELQNIGYWSFTGSGIQLFTNLPEKETDTGDYAPIMFTEETDTYYKYSEEDGGIYLYIYKTDYENYKKGDIVFVMSLEISSDIDDTYLGYVTFGPIIPYSEDLLEMPCAKFFRYNFPKDLKGTSITIDGLFSKKDNEDVRKTFTIYYVEGFGGEGYPVGMNMYMDLTIEDTQNEFSALAYLFNDNSPAVSPNGFIYVMPLNMRDTDNTESYNLTKIFSLTTSGLAPVTYTYTDENIKINSAIKVYLNDSENIQIIDRQDGYIEFKRSKVANIPFNMEILDVDKEGLVTLFNSYKEPIPTKLSQFQNDTEYLTNDDIHVTSPIMKGGSLDGKPDLWLMSTYNSSFAQYSSNIKTGTLKVDSWVEKSGEYIYTITDYSIFNSYTDALMTVNSPIILEASNLTDSKLEIKTKSKPTEPISYSYKLLATDKKGQFTIVNTYLPDSNLTIQGQNPQGTEIQKTFNGRLPIELAFNEDDFTLTEVNGALEVTAVDKPITVPTKTSDLQNDSGFITNSAIGNGTLKIQKNGVDIGTFTANQNTDITANIIIPTKISELQNDSNFITNANIPTKTSELTNDSGFIKASEANIFTLVQTFSNPNGIKTNRVHNLNNNAWYDFDGTSDRLGSLATPTIIRTSEARPKAEVPSGNSTVTKEIALLEDIAGEWVTVTGETTTLTQAGTYQVVISNDAQSIVYWDGTTAAEGIKSTIAEVDTNYMTINTTYPHIDTNGTLSMSYIVVSNATGSWVETTTTLSGFKYRKIN